MSESRFVRHAAVFSNAIFLIFRNNIVFFFLRLLLPSFLFDVLPSFRHRLIFSAQTQFLDYLLHLLYSHSVSTPFASQPFASPRPAGFHSQCPSVDHLNDLLKLFL